MRAFHSARKPLDGRGHGWIVDHDQLELDVASRLASPSAGDLSCEEQPAIIASDRARFASQGRAELPAYRSLDDICPGEFPRNGCHDSAAKCASRIAPSHGRLESLNTLTAS